MFANRRTTAVVAGHRSSSRDGHFRTGLILPFEIVYPHELRGLPTATCRVGAGRGHGHGGGGDAACEATPTGKRVRLSATTRSPASTPWPIMPAPSRSCAQSTSSPPPHPRPIWHRQPVLPLLRDRGRGHGDRRPRPEARRVAAAAERPTSCSELVRQRNDTVTIPTFAFCCPGPVNGITEGLSGWA